MKLVANPRNPYESIHREWLGPPPAAILEVYHESAPSILSKNDSPDVPFRWSVNPYRGCQHACAYCYARPYHEYLGYGAGTDFDTKLVVKTNAPELLDTAFRRRSWRGECVNFSGITDCYQPLEACYSITRRCLEVCLGHRNPVAVITKASLIRRDADLLVELNRRAGATVCISIPFADPETARAIEPQTPAPSCRFETLRVLSDSGLPVGVLVSPIIPGLNDREVPEILRLAADAGARSASYTALRLPGTVQTVFLSRLAQALPLRAGRVESRLRDARGGQLDDARFGFRMRGTGAYWDSVRRLFEVSARRFGLRATHEAPPPVPHNDQPADHQLTFGF